MAATFESGRVARHVRVHLLSREAIRDVPLATGGAKIGGKNKDHHRMEGHLMLEADYFADEPAHGPKDFRGQFRVKEVFMRFVYGVREYGDYFM